MVRAGVVEYPSEWPFYGYNEIQEPKRKNVLIDYEKLRELLGFDSYERMTTYHKRWIDDYLDNGKNTREDKWTKSIAVGNKAFVDRIKSLMGIMAIGRKSIETVESYQLREPSIPYGDHFGAKKNNIGPENTYFWNVNIK